MLMARPPSNLDCQAGSQPACLLPNDCHCGTRRELSTYPRFQPLMKRLTPFLAVLTALMVSQICRADGLIIIENPPVHIAHHFPFAPLEVTYHHVDVSIDNTVAATSIDQEFYNPNGARLEGTYIFPLPAGAHID